MGTKDRVAKAGTKVANQISRWSVLSNAQLDQVKEQREAYLAQKPHPDDGAAEELTRRLLAACSVDIYKAYLGQLPKLYAPLERTAEYDGKAFDAVRNIRFFNITKWVVDKRENNLEKLVNVYAVLSDENCNIALVFHRTCEKTNVFLAVSNTQNQDNNVASKNFKTRLEGAIRGNFPGAEWANTSGAGVLPCMDNNTPYSVAIASNIPAEKSEKFISQTIEKLLDGIVPEDRRKEYILVLLATPILDLPQRKLHLSELYSGLAPYATWSTTFTYDEQNSTGSSATVGVNIGASAGIQNGQNQAETNSKGTTDSTGETVTESTSDATTTSQGETVTDSTGESVTDSAGTTNTVGSSHAEGTSTSHADSEGSSQTGGINAGIHLGVEAGAQYSNTGSHTVTETGGTSVSDTLSGSTAETLSKSVASTLGRSIAKSTGTAVTSTVGKAVAHNLGRAVSQSVSRTVGAFQSTSFGVNFGANFARTSNITTTIGKSEGIQQNFTNHNIRHTLDILEKQMQRLELSTALGMWDFAAYVLSEDMDVANNVAHAYLALTQGEESYLSQSAINLWRGDANTTSDVAKEICAYLRDLRHPLFVLKPQAIQEQPDYQVYPPVVTATVNLSGRELAYSLNFPQKSVSGLPVITCAEFGRNVISYTADPSQEAHISLGHIFHMNHEEVSEVPLSLASLASHTFVTGSTGSGKSYTIYELLSQAMEQDVRFLVVEPSKGEYKHIFGALPSVTVFGTNPARMPLLKLNPFRFPKEIHVLEHLDRLVELFNVCWPMYAAMPAVLKQAVERAYLDCGWDLVRSVPRTGEPLFPSFDDVAYHIRDIINKSEYDGENKGAYKGALLTRLQALTTGLNGLIFTSDDIPDEVLFQQNVIVDISRVGSSETKSLIMGMLVLKLQEYHMANANGMNASLRHLTVLEEAHHLLKRTSGTQSAENGNLQGKSVEMLANAIAEMRTYGEGFVIADQAPGLLDLSVIRNTNTKILLRLPDQTDRELVGRAAGLNDDQIAELSKLPCGVAAVYQNEWVQPVLCKVAKFSSQPIPYTYPFSPDDEPVPDSRIVSQALLDFLMNQTLLKREDRIALDRLRQQVLRSSLNTAVKQDVSAYCAAHGSARQGALCRLLYDFLSAEEAIQSAHSCHEISDWVANVSAKLVPSIRSYSQEQQNLALALILKEQAERDAEYTDMFCRFVELYQTGRKGF